MSDIATVVSPPTRRRLNIKPSMYWPLGLTAGAVLYFIYSYLDTYFRAQVIPPGLHEFMTTYLPLLNVNEAIIYAMAALGLNIVVGYAGLLDLGFVAFWAIGGYTAGWLASDFFYSKNLWFFGAEFARGKPGVHLNVWMVLIAGGILCGIAGIIIGAPTLRLRSDYLALVTLGFGEIIYEVAYNGDNLFGVNVTNGNRSISPTDYPRFFAFTPDGTLTWRDLLPSDGLPKFILFCLLAAVILFASLRIREGRLGRAWLAIREDELAASMMGVPLMKTKLSAYALGAVAGGIAGVAYSIHVNGVFPDQLKFSISITLLAMVVLGGMGNVWGVTIGALILAWVNSTLLKQAQIAIDSSEATGNAISIVLAIIGIGLVVGGILLVLRSRPGLILVFIGVPLLVISAVLAFAKGTLSFQFFIFGTVLIIMMLFRREGLIPEARTRLVLREPGRTEMESLGADMEEVAPELESLTDEAVHAGGTVPPSEATDIDGKLVMTQLMYGEAPTASYSSGAALTADGLTVRFGGLVAVNRVSFDIPLGGIVSLIGPNGAGKTTFFNALTGLYELAEGAVHLGDRDITGMPPHKIAGHGVARTFQNIRLFGLMTAEENIKVAMHGHLRAGVFGTILRAPWQRHEEKRAHEEALDLLEFVGVGGVADEYARNLSYGDQRRLEVARALALKPSVLLLDEPTAGMNPRESAVFTDFVHRVRDEKKVSVLLIEHDMSVVMRVSERITVLDRGEKIAEGSPVEIKSNERVIEAYLGKGQEA